MKDLEKALGKCRDREGLTELGRKAMDITFPCVNLGYGLVCLLNQLCYTGGVHIKTIPKKENTMNTINLYDLKYAIDNDPRVRNADIDSQYMSDDTLIANIKDEKTQNGTKGYVTINIAEGYPDTVLYSVYQKGDRYAVTTGHHDFSDDNEYDTGAQEIIDDAYNTLLTM